MADITKPANTESKNRDQTAAKDEAIAKQTSLQAEQARTGVIAKRHKIPERPPDVTSEATREAHEAALASEAEAVKLRTEADHESKQQQPVSAAAQPPDPPMTVIPERKVRKPGRFTHGQLCGQDIPFEEIEAKLKQKPKSE